MVLLLALAPIPTTAKDCSDRLLTKGVVRGDVEQVMGGTGLQIAELVDQGLIGCPREERTDDVYVNGTKKGVAPF